MKKLLILCLLGYATNIFANLYETPPTSATSTSVPVISDEQMYYCVKIYNEAKWLAQDLNSAYVDQYNENAVFEYNEAVRRHSSMINWFNENCAGKQSQSAYEAARKLNNQN